MTAALALLNAVFWIAVTLVGAALAAWAFRALLATLAPGDRRLWRTMPLPAAFGMLVVLLYALAGLLAPWLAPFPERAVVGDAYLPWGGDFLLGTDNLGRDVFSRLIFGARNSVGIALLTTILAFGVGATLGLAAAAVGGWLDTALSRLVDVLMAIPALILALLLLTLLGASIPNMILVIALIDSTRVFRLARAVAADIAAQDYIEAARLRGESLPWLVRREILPNALSPLLAEFGLRFCFVFLSISALSFLGLGIQPPAADWGSMVKDSATLITFGDPTPLLPAGAIALLTVAVNFVVDWQLHRASGLKE